MVIGGEPVDQRLAGDLLQTGVERRAHRKTAAVELVLAENVDDVAANLLGKEFRGGKPRAGWPHLHAKRLSLRGLSALLGDIAILNHAVDHPIAALDRPLREAERIIVTRRLG